MRYVPRRLAGPLAAALRSFPAVVLTGPRRAGKTYLLQHEVPGASYHLLEDPATIARLRADPVGFLDGVKLPAILDEVQNVPEVFAHVRARIDREPRRTGRWILAGSQDSALMRGVTESMAGRAAILQLLPLSITETPRVGLLRGGFPEVIARPRAASLWFASYVQTYLERDVRQVTQVHDLATFRRFFALVASRHGQVLNKTDLAAPLGLSVPSVGRWLDILETTQQILVVPPYFENVGKRLIKAPKIFVTDSGLACHLLGIESAAELGRSPFLGALFEGWIAAEIVKAQTGAGRRRELYYFRDQQGLEVDFVVPAKNGSIELIDARASRTPRTEDARSLQRLGAAFEARGIPSRRISRFLVHRGPSSGTSALAPGVEAMTIEELLGRI